MQKRLFTTLNDKNGFLKAYLKDNLPRMFYKRAFNRRISDVDYLNDYELPSKYADDMKAYWQPYEKTTSLWHRVYKASSGIWDVRYIPEDIFYRKIEPALNRIDLANAYVDKNLYRRHFSDLHMPTAVIRNINGTYYTDQYEKMNEDIAVSFIQVVADNHKIVIKPSLESGSGKNVQVFDLRGEEPTRLKDRIRKMLRDYEGDFVVQEYLKQHSLLSQIHPDSLNTLRVLSLRFDDEIHILSTVLRMGDNGSKIDNHDNGYLTVGMNAEGQLNDFAVNHWTFEKYEEHPYTQFVFKNVTIPNLDSVHAIAKKAHEKLYYFNLVSWDFAIDVDGQPTFIELNLKDQDINYHQRVNGPLFGDMTDDVLKMVYE